MRKHHGCSLGPNSCQMDWKTVDCALWVHVFVNQRWLLISERCKSVDDGVRVHQCPGHGWIAYVCMYLRCMDVYWYFRQTDAAIEVTWFPRRLLDNSACATTAWVCAHGVCGLDVPAYSSDLSNESVGDIRENQTGAVEQLTSYSQQMLHFYNCIQLASLVTYWTKRVINEKGDIPHVTSLPQCFLNALQVSNSEFASNYKMHVRWSLKTQKCLSLYFCQINKGSRTNHLTFLSMFLSTIHTKWRNWPRPLLVY